MKNVDIVIIGGGMVGLALACGLQDSSSFRVVVIERKLPKMSLTKETFLKSRTSAINTASEKFLIRLGVWSEIISCRASCFHNMEVWDKDSFGRIDFNDKGIGYNHLGYIIENAVIHSTLWRKIQQRNKNVTLIVPEQVQQIVWGENDAFIITQSGDILTTRLVVGADGANSWLRSKLDIPLIWWDYRHYALVAIARTTKSHDAVARQIFHNDEILAFLPLNDPHLCSIVWSLLPEKALHLQSVDPKIFNQALCIAFDNRLGLCTLESKRKVFPLIGRYARQFAGHRFVLVGDAAHTIHPLVGQGVNLGFMDAAELVGELLRLYREGKDIGQYLYLRRYERNRKYNAAIMLAGTQGLYKLFVGNNPVKKLLRDIGLRLADTIPGIKSQLLHQAMGLNDLPNWLF